MGMEPPRRLRILSPEELGELTTQRLLSYRKKCLSLENSPEDSDYDSAEIDRLDAAYIWFKTDPRWNAVYASVLSAINNRQH